MTTEEKAKHYDEAIRRAKIALGCCNSASIITKRTIYDIFPELKEDESKKWILEYLYDGLRRSDEQFKEQFKAAIAWIENQCEQKSVDKVNLKFKVGDWILYSGDHYEGVRHITKVDENGYYIERNGLPHGIIPFNHEICMRLWNIADARDGDVLVDCLSGDNQITVLFKCVELDTSIHAYCGWNHYNFRVTTDGTGYGTLSSTKYVPATKEQHDLLFQKMREAGYEWDAKKKELKKISRHMVSAEAKEAMYDKLAWSEEDEIGFNDTLWAIQQARTIAKDENDMGNLWYAEDWIKSLKERMK